MEGLIRSGVIEATRLSVMSLCHFADRHRILRHRMEIRSDGIKKHQRMLVPNSSQTGASYTQTPADNLFRNSRYRLLTLSFILERKTDSCTVCCHLAIFNHHVELHYLCHSKVPQRFSRGLDSILGGSSHETLLVPTISVMQ